MTTEINKYHTSKIYKISSPQCDKFYIGSTTQTLKERLRHHKLDYKRYIEKGIGCLTSFEILKFDDCIIELIKDVNCENRKELERTEGEYVKEYHNRILNKTIPGRTHKEWRDVNKDKIKQYAKKYLEGYREKLYEKIVCNCGGKYIFREKTRHEKTKKHQLFISNQS